MILVFSLFLLLLIAALSVINISDNFLAKRQLVEIGEVAITRAAHQISLSRYYSGDILMYTSGVDGTLFRIPVDCPSAYNSFSDELLASSLRGSRISIREWNCVGDEGNLRAIEIAAPGMAPRGGARHQAIVGRAQRPVHFRANGWIGYHLPAIRAVF